MTMLDAQERHLRFKEHEACLRPADPSTFLSFASLPHQCSLPMQTGGPGAFLRRSVSCPQSPRKGRRPAFKPGRLAQLFLTAPARVHRPNPSGSWLGGSGLTFSPSSSHPSLCTSGQMMVTQSLLSGNPNMCSPRWAESVPRCSGSCQSARHRPTNRAGKRTKG